MGLLIETAQHRLLYDTGLYYSPESNTGNLVIVPHLKARGIAGLDTVVISHSGNDHSGGTLSVFEAMDVDNVYSSLPRTHRIVTVAPAHTRFQDIQSWNWDGVQFDMLFPATTKYTENELKVGSANMMSCTLRITNGAYSILLPGDIEKAQERQLLFSHADQFQSNVLLAPHHGSGTSSNIGFLQEVDPNIVLFQLGYRNRFRHPKAKVLERYQQLGIDKHRNDQSGAITLCFASTLDVSEYRQHHKRYWYGR